MSINPLPRQIPPAQAAQAVTRARQALRHLEAHPATTVSQLGAARDRYNDVHRLTGRTDVLDAVYALECLVLDVLGGPPTS